MRVLLPMANGVGSVYTYTHVYVCEGRSLYGVYVCVSVGCYVGSGRGRSLLSLTLGSSVDIPVSVVCVAPTKTTGGVPTASLRSSTLRTRRWRGLGWWDDGCGRRVMKTHVRRDGSV